MSSSPEIEQFEITDDDFASAFNPESKRFRMSKNQQIYGTVTGYETLYCTRTGNCVILRNVNSIFSSAN